MSVWKPEGIGADEAGNSSEIEKACSGERSRNFSMKLENNLDTDDIKGLVWRLAFPSMLAQFVQCSL